MSPAIFLPLFLLPLAAHAERDCDLEVAEAKVAMYHRQYINDLQDLLKPGLSPRSRALLIRAFQQPRETSIDRISDAVKDFGNEALLSCLQSKEQKSR